MNTIKPYIDTLLKIWEENSPAARIGILFLATLCAVVIGAVGYWSVQPNYVVLVSDLETEKIDRVIDGLAKAGIDYQLSGAGGVVMVDRRDLTRAKGVSRSAGVSESAVEYSGGLVGQLAPKDARERMEREKKESHLAKTIQNMSIVDSAVVYLNTPGKSLFIRDHSKPTASVMLELMPGAQLSDTQAQAIASLVAYAVADLTPENVQITDKEGRNYSQPDASVQQISSQVEYVQQMERNLVEKARSQLDPFLGFGNSHVKVALDLTFTNGSRTITKYDKDGKVPSEENLNTKTTTNRESSPSGPAGTASNLQTRSRGASNIEEKEEEITTSYLVPKTEEVETNTTPIRNQMTVSVVVNSEAEGLKGEDGTINAEIEKAIEELVRNAVGFREETDQITVKLMPFAVSDTMAEPPVAPFEWKRVTDIVEKTSLAIAAIFAFLMGLLLLKKVRPLAEPDDSADLRHGSERERSESVSQLSEMIKNNPEVFAQVVKSWSGNDPSGSPSRTRAA